MGKRKEEERRILAELEEAVAKEREVQKEEETAPKQKCPRCKSEMTEGVCDRCGHKVYVEMSEEKRKKIRRILTVACLGIFLVLFLLIKL